MLISLSDMLRVKREARKLRIQHPDASHNHRLSQAATQLFGVRGYHELKKLRDKSINQHLAGTGSLVKCTYCGLEFCIDIADDQKTHRDRHDAFEEAVCTLNYAPRQHADREALKQEGYELLNDPDLEQKVRGALMVIRAWFDRSLDAAIDGKYWKKHPGFDQYVAYVVGNLPSFPPQVVNALVQSYGKKDGVIPKGRSYWYPPK